MDEEMKWASYTAAGYAISYLRKMRQWNEGKIELQVEGCEPPHRMTNEEIEEEMQNMLHLRDLL